MEIDRVDEPLDVAEAVGFLLDRLDFVVHPLGQGIGRAQFEIRDDPFQVIIEHLGHLDDRRQAAVRGPEIPVPEKAARPLGKDEVPHPAKVLLDRMGAPGLQVILAAIHKTLHARIGQVLGPVEPVPLGLVQEVDALGLQVARLLLAHVIDRFIQVTLQVETVQHRLLVGPGNPLAAGGAVGLPHVHREALDLAQHRLGQAREEAIQRLFRAVLAHPDHLGRVQVVDHRDVVMPFKHGLFINTDAAQLGQVALGQPAAHRAGDDAIGLVPRDAQQAAGARHRHLQQGVDGEALELQREARVLLRPRRGDRLDAAVGALGARQRGADQRLELAGVQVAPDALLAVLYRAARTATCRASQRRRRRQLDPHANGLGRLVHAHRGDLPGGRKPQDLFIQSGITHQSGSLFVEGTRQGPRSTASGPLPCTFTRVAVRLPGNSHHGPRRDLRSSPTSRPHPHRLRFPDCRFFLGGREGGFFPHFSRKSHI